MSFLLQLDCVPNIYICAAPSAHNPQTLFEKQIKYLKPVKNCDANTQVIKKFDSNSKVIRKSQQSPMCGSYLLLLAAMKVEFCCGNSPASRQRLALRKIPG